MCSGESRTFEEMCSEMVSLLKADNIPVVLWGNISECLYLPWFERNEIKIEHICDQRKLNDGGKTILPSEISGLYDNQQFNAVIVVPYPVKIKKEIDGLQHKPKRIFYLDVALLHEHPNLFKRPDNRWTEVNNEKVKDVQLLLEDDESKKVFHNLLNYWISGKHSLVQQYAEKQSEQYLDTIPLGNEEIFLNIGACDGRYSQRFIERVTSYKAVYNMECDPENFLILQDNMKKYRNCYCINKGAWDKSEVLCFSAEGNAGSFINKDGNVKIAVDSIDSLFPDIPISFIKADIEGAEYKMLDGAKKILNKVKPKLAICCYHQIDDLVGIPLKIKALNPEYRLKMRHYTDTLTETVCYAY